MYGDIQDYVVVAPVVCIVLVSSVCCFGAVGGHLRGAIGSVPRVTSVAHLALVLVLAALVMLDIAASVLFGGDMVPAGWMTRGDGSSPFGGDWLHVEWGVRVCGWP